MNAEAWDADVTVPPATLPDALVTAVMTTPAALIKGNEPGEVAILIEADTFSG
jgi:hypothetical protein